MKRRNILNHTGKLIGQIQDTASIPGTVKRRGKGTWDGNMCINFASHLLDCKYTKNDLGTTLTRDSVIKATIVEDGVWRIRRKERSPSIEIFKLEKTGHGDILSDEFINWRIKLAMNQNKPDENANQAKVN